MSTTAPQFVTRLIRRSEVPRHAEIIYDAFSDPTNTTPDEMSQLIHDESESEAGRPVPREESIEKRIQGENEMFDKNKYTFVGVYALPPSSPHLEDGEGEMTDSSSLPEGSLLVGTATWQRIDSSTQSEIPEKKKKAEEKPTLLNRFFVQMDVTRENAMKGKEYWFLKLLAIDPKYQRKGLGTMLVKWGTERSNKEGIDAWLESSPMGKGAYLKAGFRVLGMDKIDHPRAKKGYVEWPYMIHEHKPTN